MNMAREIVKKGYCRDINEVFEKYLGTSGKAYCEAKRLTPVAAVKLIKKYGGVCIRCTSEKIPSRQEIGFAFGRLETVWA